LTPFPAIENSYTSAAKAIINPITENPKLKATNSAPDIFSREIKSHRPQAIPSNPTTTPKTELTFNLFFFVFNA